jgi:NAD(P)-dependent dehydrogenase (short-subunit alcohol dehydrogenase family)
MQELAGRTAVVTGAASGIGLATASAFAREGMHVVLADIEEQPLALAEKSLLDAGYDVLAVRTDVSSWDDVQHLADRTIERFGAVHVVHNNAGVVLAGPVEELSLADWEWVLGIDLWGVVYGVKAFVPLIKKAGEGHIVNTASSAGLYSGPSIGPYNVAKHGVVALTETLQRELAIDGDAIRASVLCPGMVDTRIVESDRNRSAAAAADHARSAQEDEFKTSAAARLKKVGLDPDDVAKLVLGAVRDGRFWILPHPRWIDVLRDRVEGMADDGRLNEGFGG